MVFLLSVQRAAELNIFIPFVYFNELARFGQFVKYTLFRSPFCPHLVPISAAEGPHLFPISLKIRYPLGPHSEKFRSPFHVGRGEYFSEKSTFLHGPRKWPCKRLQQYLWEQYVTPTVSLSPQLYHCFYCHMLYDGNGQGWGAYWNLTPTVAPLYMMRYWSGIVNFGWLISIRCTGSDQSKMWYALLLAVLSCFSEVGHIYGKMGGAYLRNFFLP